LSRAGCTAQLVGGEEAWLKGKMEWMNEDMKREWVDESEGDPVSGTEAKNLMRSLTVRYAGVLRKE